MSETMKPKPVEVLFAAVWHRALPRQEIAAVHRELEAAATPTEMAAVALSRDANAVYLPERPLRD